MVFMIVFTKVLNYSVAARSVFIFTAIEFSLGFCNAIFPCFDYFRVLPCRILTVNTQTRISLIGFDMCIVARQLYSVVSQSSLFSSCFVSNVRCVLLR